MKKKRRRKSEEAKKRKRKKRGERGKILRFIGVAFNPPPFSLFLWVCRLPSFLLLR